MLVVMRPVIILHERGIAVVEIYNSVGEEVFFIAEMDLLRWNACPIIVSYVSEPMLGKRESYHLAILSGHGHGNRLRFS